MLSKVASDSSAGGQYNKNLGDYSNSVTKKLDTSTSNTTLYTVPKGIKTISGTITQTCDISVSTSNFVFYKVMSKDGNTTISTIGSNTGGNKNYTFSNISVSEGCYLKLQIDYANTSSSATFNISSSLNGKYQPPKTGINGKPREKIIKAIGEKTTTTIFGVHTDNSRVSQS